MPEAIVRGVRLSYAVIGTQGPWVALTPGSRRGFGELKDIARMIAENGFRVLLHDRRNCGASEVAIEPKGSEHEIWADDLHELCIQLGSLPVYVGGSSAGARLAILFALRHPNATKGLLLWRLTGGSHATTELAEIYYGAFIKQAKQGGMAAVCSSEHFSACITARPTNRERLMTMVPDEFIHVMDMWRQEFLRSANMPIIGATEDELRSMAAPVCLIAGNDVIHPPAVARKITAILPNAELHDNVVKKRPDEDLLPEWDKAEWSSREALMAQIFSDFLKRAEHP